MGLLEQITGPARLRTLTIAQAEQLAAEIRDFLVQAVSRTGGHLGPNLGVVELTIAMHRVFSSPTDTFVFDTGHQSYVHKLLTGRQDFSRLRRWWNLYCRLKTDRRPSQEPRPMRRPHLLRWCLRQKRSH